MAAPKDFVTGFNHNVRHKGQGFHVQTEDSGSSIAHVITHLFQGGNILASKKTSYSELRGAPDLKAKVRSLMEEQHRQMLRQLVNGAFDRIVESEGVARGAPRPAAEGAGREGAAGEGRRPEPIRIIRFPQPGSPDVATVGFLPPITPMGAGRGAGAAPSGEDVAAPALGGVLRAPETPRDAAMAREGREEAAPLQQHGHPPPSDATPPPGGPLWPTAQEAAAQLGGAAAPGALGAPSPEAAPAGALAPTPGPQSVFARTPGPQGAFSQSPGPQSAFSQSPGPQSVFSQSPGPQSVFARTPGPQGALSQSPGPQSAHARTPGPAAWSPEPPMVFVEGDDGVGKSLDQVILRYLAGERDDEEEGRE